MTVVNVGHIRCTSLLREDPKAMLEDPLCDLDVLLVAAVMLAVDDAA